MKKMILPAVLVVSLFSASLPVYAWGPPPPPPAYRHYHHHGYHGHRVHAGDVIGGVILGGLVLGGIAAAMSPPAQYVTAPPVYVQPAPQVVVQQPRACVEERKVTGEYQYNQADGTTVWVTFPYPVLRRYEVPCN